MSALSDYIETAWLNTLRGVAFTALSNLYVGLHTAEGADEGSAAWRTTEVGAIGSYARTAVPAAGWAAPVVSGGRMQIVNSGDVTFVTATASWGTLTHWSVWDGASLTTANLLYKEALAVPKIINNGDVAKFTAGNLVLGLQ